MLKRLYMTEIEQKPSPAGRAATRFVVPQEIWIVRLALGVIVVTMIVSAFQRQLLEQPILGDESAHIYLGQAALHGQFPYRDIIQFQPPTRLIFPIVWALVARLTDLPIVHVARYFGLAIHACIIILSYGVVFNMTGSRI